MAYFNAFSRVFGIDRNNHELCLAQYRVISSQAPLYYLIMIGAIFSVSYVSMSSVPAYLTIVSPLVLLTGFLAVYYGYAIPRSLTLNSYRRAVVFSLHLSVWATIGFGASYGYWIYSISQYVSVELLYLIVGISGIAVFGASVCLMHLRSAAIALFIFSLAPIAAYLWLSGDTNQMVIASLLSLISLIFTKVAYRYGDDFSNLTTHRIKIEAQKKLAEKVSASSRILANLDSLTGLANRRAFMANLNSKVENARLNQIDGLAVGILDLDGFKQINDIYGHKVGDRLLQIAGNRLKELLVRDLFIARLGGDEFGLIGQGDFSVEQLNQLGQRICETMSVPFDMGDFSAHLGGTVGFAKLQNGEFDGGALFEQADYALYHAKDNVRGGVMIFNETHARTIREVSGVDRRLRDASLKDEMSLVYQPIVTLDGKTIGFEALARWNSPILGSISPDVFIRSAERAGTINELTAILLEKALEESREWPHDLFLSFNLSMQDIMSTKAMIRLVSVVTQSGFPPHRITFEVTETSMMHDYERATQSLALLKNMGCKIALDDFGTGYSSLAYVLQMPLDKLKLDRKFIAEIENDADARAIVGSIFGMCKQLNIECIVEGVETVGQFETLKKIGCDIIQGYYFSRPLVAMDARAYVMEAHEAKQVS